MKIISARKISMNPEQENIKKIIPKHILVKFQGEKTTKRKS
jgi:hypothetical protein